MQAVLDWLSVNWVNVVLALAFGKLFLANMRKGVGLQKIAKVLEVLRTEDDASVEDAITGIKDECAGLANGVVYEVNEAVANADPKKTPRNFWGKMFDNVIGPSLKMAAEHKIKDMLED